jgi:hypothetical protein
MAVFIEKPPVTSSDCYDPEPEYTLDISSDYSTSFDNMSSLLNLPNHFSVVHYNVQCIIHKLDVLSYELQSIDVLCFTETLLYDSHHFDDLASVAFTQ